MIYEVHEVERFNATAATVCRSESVYWEPRARDKQVRVSAVMDDSILVPPCAHGPAISVSDTSAHTYLLFNYHCSFLRSGLNCDSVE